MDIYDLDSMPSIKTLTDDHLPAINRFTESVLSLLSQSHIGMDTIRGDIISSSKGNRFALIHIPTHKNATIIHDSNALERIMTETFVFKLPGPIPAWEVSDHDHHRLDAQENEICGKLYRCCAEFMKEFDAYVNHEILIRNGAKYCPADLIIFNGDYTEHFNKIARVISDIHDL